MVNLCWQKCRRRMMDWILYYLMSCGRKGLDGRMG